MGKHTVSFYQTKKRALMAQWLRTRLIRLQSRIRLYRTVKKKEKQLERTGRVICVIGYSIMKQLAIWKHWNKLSKRQSYQVFVSEWGEADVECSVSFEILEHT